MVRTFKVEIFEFKLLMIVNQIEEIIIGMNLDVEGIVIVVMTIEEDPLDMMTDVVVAEETVRLIDIILHLVDMMMMMIVMIDEEEEVEIMMIEVEVVEARQTIK
jgi:hypothetical protein